MPESDQTKNARKSDEFEPSDVYLTGDAGPQQAPHGSTLADADERDVVSPVGDVYQTGDAGPQRPGRAPRADADAIDETTTLGDVYRTGDAGPQRPGSVSRADADEPTEASRE